MDQLGPSDEPLIAAKSRALAGPVDRHRSAGADAADLGTRQEAAKVIENTQRDLNIALMNELAIIFHRLGLDTGEAIAVCNPKRVVENYSAAIEREPFTCHLG
jgi:hypothetical protein